MRKKTGVTAISINLATGKHQKGVSTINWKHHHLLKDHCSKVGENCGNISSDGESKIAIPDHTRSKKGIKRNCFTQSK